MCAQVTLYNELRYGRDCTSLSYGLHNQIILVFDYLVTNTLHPTLIATMKCIQFNNNLLKVEKKSFFEDPMKCFIFQKKYFYLLYTYFFFFFFTKFCVFHLIFFWTPF